VSFQDLVELMDALRGERGCPWDKEQTLDSLKPFLIEEAYEVIEAIEHNDSDKLKEELGDLLFHILFMSKVSAEMGKFSIDDVAKFVHWKMTRRHPHVFGPHSGRQTAETESRSAEAVSGAAQPESCSSRSEGLSEGAGLGKVTSQRSAQVLKQWYEMKQEERARKGSTSLMDGIPSHLPALQKAQKVQRRAAQVGFDWEKPEEVLEKISEEVRELRQAIARHDQGHICEEIGDLMFSVVNVCRFLKVDAEGALRGTIAKFAERFRAMEQQAAASGKTLTGLSLEEMDTLWESIKARPGQDSVNDGRT